MPNYCKVVVCGHLTRDVEIRYTQGGMSIAELGICFNNRRKQGEQWLDEPCFLDAVAFGKLAERMADARKGDAYLLEGKLSQDNWTDKSGQKRSKIKLTVDHAMMLGGSGSPARGGSRHDGDDSPF